MLSRSWGGGRFVAMALGQEVWLFSQHAHCWSQHHAATSRLERGLREQTALVNGLHAAYRPDPLSAGRCPIGGPAL